MAWKDVVATDDYKSLSKEDRTDLRERYFQKNVAPKIQNDSDPEDSKKMWYGITEDLDPDLKQGGFLSSMKDFASKAGEGFAAGYEASPGIPAIGRGLKSLFENTEPSNREKWEQATAIKDPQQRMSAIKDLDVAEAQLLGPEVDIPLTIATGGTAKLLKEGVTRGLGRALAKDIGSSITGGISDIAEAGIKTGIKKLSTKQMLKQLKNEQVPTELFQVAREKVKDLTPEQVKDLGIVVRNNEVPEIAPYITELSNRVGVDEAQKVVKNFLPDIERNGEHRLLNELSDAVYRKETIGDMGDVNKIVSNSKMKNYKLKDGTVFTGRQNPVYEAELNILKELPVMKKTQGVMEPSNRYIDRLGDNFKKITSDRVRQATHLKNLEYGDVARNINKYKKDLGKKSSERIGIYATAMQKDGKELLEKHRIKIPELSEKEMEAYQYMRGEYEKLYNRLNEARLRSGKEPFGKRQDYFTFFKELDKANAEGFNPVTAKLDTLENFMRPKTTAFRFSKERSKNDLMVDLDSFNVFKKYNLSALEHIHLSPELAKIKSFNNILNDNGKKFVLREVNPYAAEFLDQWVFDNLGGESSTKLGLKSLKPIDNFFKKMNKNLIYSTLSYNLDSAVKQALALRNSISEIGARNVAKGVEMNMSPKWRNFVKQRSGAFHSRIFESGIDEAMKGSKKLKEKIGRAGLTPLQKLDEETARITWLGSFKDGLDKYGNTEKAIRYADDILIRTQGSASRIDKAPISRTPMGRTFSLFQTFANSDWRYLKHDVLGLGKDGQKLNKNKLFRYLVSTAVLNKVYNDGFGMDAFPNPIKALEEAEAQGHTGARKALDAIIEVASVHPLFGSAKYGSTVGGAAVNTIMNIYDKLQDGKGVDPVAGILEAVKLAGVPGAGRIAKRYNIYKKGGTGRDVIFGNYPDRKKKQLGIGKIK